MQRGNAAFDNRGLSKEKWLLIYVDCGCDGCGNVDCGCSAIFLFDNRVAKGKYWWAGSKILLYRQHTKGSRFPLQIIFFGKKTFKSKKLPQYSIHSLGLNRNSGWYIAIFWLDIAIVVVDIAIFWLNVEYFGSLLQYIGLITSLTEVLLQAVFPPDNSHECCGL